MSLILIYDFHFARIFHLFSLFLLAVKIYISFIYERGVEVEWDGDGVGERFIYIYFFFSFIACMISAYEIVHAYLSSTHPKILCALFCFVCGA
jgi:hypothetical protein